MLRMLKGLPYLLLFVGAFCVGSSLATAQGLPNGFEDTLIFTREGTLITAFEKLPNGTFAIGDRDGQIRILNPEGETGPAPLVSLRVRVVHEGGVVSIVPDPEFAQTRRIYFSFTQERDDGSMWITIATVALDAADPLRMEPGSYRLVFSLPDERDSTIHYGGGLYFDTAETLLLGIGDDADSDNSQDLASLRGKILRIRKDGSVPSDNPVIEGTQSAIYAYGLRNPFRLYPNPLTGEIYLSDVGSTRFEEINVVLPGANYGWPLVEGSLAQNPGATPPPDFLEPLASVPHGGGTSGTAVALTDGVVYTGTRFPERWRNRLFVADWRYEAGVIHVFDPSGGAPFPPPETFAVYEEIAPNDFVLFDDDIYYAAHAFSPVPEENRSFIRRIRYTEPRFTVAIEASAAAGGLPFSPTLSAQVEGPATLPLNVDWDLGDGRRETGETITPVYTERGWYTVTARVTDAAGAKATVQVRIGALDRGRLVLNAPTLAGEQPGEVPFVPDSVTFRHGNREPLRDLSGRVVMVTPTSRLTYNAPILTDGEPLRFEVHRGDAVLEGSLAPDQAGGHFLNETLHLSPVSLRGRMTTPLGAPNPELRPGLEFLVPGGIKPHPWMERLYGPDAGGHYYLPIPAGLTGLEARAFAEGTEPEKTLNEAYFTFDRAQRWDAMAVSPASTPCSDRDALGPLPGWPEVRAIFNRECVGCHGSVTPNGGLSLVEGHALAELVARPSLSAPGLMLVDPTDPKQSFILEKLDCLEPRGGAPMPPGGQLDEADIQLIHDWVLGRGWEETGPLRASVITGQTALVSPGRLYLRGGGEGGIPPYTLEWFIDDEPAQTGLLFDSVYSATFQQRTFPVRLLVTDTVGNRAEEIIPVTVSLPSDGMPEPPVVTLEASGSLVAGRVTHLEVLPVSNPNGPLVLFEWDFDDDGTIDQTTTTPTASHVYTEGGNRTARVVVTDGGNGVTSVTTTLEIAGDPLSGVYTY